MTRSENYLPLVYDRLRKFARMRFGQNDSLTGTALVHEAYISIAEADQDWDNISHFMGAVRNAMRNAIVDHIRKKTSKKHGGGRRRIEKFDFGGEFLLPEIVALNDALNELAVKDQRAASVVTMKFFACMTEAEIARVFDVSPRTITRDWTYARAWLRKELDDE